MQPFKSHFEGKTLFDAFCDASRKYGSNKPQLEDATGGSLTFKRIMIGANVLARKFKPIFKPGEAAGILLPNAAGSTVSLLALQSIGAVPAMLNFTAGNATVVSSCETAAIKTIITSRRFIEKGELEGLIAALEETGYDFIWLEELRDTVNLFDKVRSALTAMRPLYKSKPEDPAVILFTSGSEGAPKGVVLSHANILANCSQVAQRIYFDNTTDRVFSALPVFHSLGMTGGMVLPLIYGVPLYLYPSPLHYKIIPKQVAQTKSTILFGTDTFLNGYARAAKDQDFDSLRMVVAGAEPVQLKTSQTWKERFKVDVLEGFGMTEAAPVLAVNTVEENKLGTVGKLLPGIETKLEAVEGISDGGKLFVNGPNLMIGYMKPDQPGVIQKRGNDWHDSGDIVHIDDEGYVTIKGRVKRFAKLAGEMVSLTLIETIIKTLSPDEEHAVVAVSDKRKGEKIVLLTTDKKLDKKAISEAVKKQEYSDFLIPGDIKLIDTIPLLGSGKTDYGTAKSIAEAS